MTAAALAVTRLTLTRFRGYEFARVEPGPGLVVLTGPNGAGKTNLLEAVSLMAPGRGLRNARLSDLTRQGSAAGTGWAVAGSIATPKGPVDIGTGLDEGERRAVRIDGRVARSQTSLADYVTVTWLTPQMDRLFQEGASGRRRFLDRLVFGFDPAHAGRLARYEHALRERARLLRDGVGDDAWLSGLEDQLATTGVAVAAARVSVIDRLRAATDRATGPFPAAELAVEGGVEVLLARGPALAAEDEVRRRLRLARRDDRAAGGATIGPHRSDFVVHHRAKAMPAAHCSTGEQKALLIAIVLANARLLAAERGAAPLLLLDEVTAHLDQDRRDALFAALEAQGVQAWLSGTDLGDFAALGPSATYFRIEEARIVSG